MNLPSRLLCALTGLLMLFVCGSLIPGHQDLEPIQTNTPDDLTFLEPGAKLRTIRAMPTRITAVLAIQDSDGLGEVVYVGTGGSSAIYRLYNGRDGFLLGTRTIAVGLGDVTEHCTCEVNRLAAHDLDNDGVDELIAETSQIMPRGRPRIYVWSGDTSPILRGFVRPAIESSWGHGVAFVHHDDRDSIVSTYCGYGEIVEYRLNNSATSDGYRDESIGWRILGRLPASGEGIQVTDVDNDGEPEVCLATGYAENKAALHVYDYFADGVIETPKIVIDEEQRYGTIEFVVGSLSRDGARELFVWWCTGLSDGHAEFIRYRIGPRGVTYREVIAAGSSAEIWPIGGQITIMDTNLDGNNEVWFCTVSGNLYRYDPSESPNPSLACHVSGGFGPIAAGGVSRQPCLYVGSGTKILQFTRSESK